jgi:Arc/MetJ-type ribon-helix-helix transcriptional regulator
MTITLKQNQEEAVLNAIRAGMFRSVDEFIDAAIAILPDVPAPGTAAPPTRKSRLRELTQGLSLGELSIKELIEEGRE